MLKNISKNQVATAIALLFHFFGMIGILFWDKNLFINATPLNLLLMFGLLVWTQPEKNKAYLLFAVLTMLIGFLVEVMGVNTALLFGDYTYGEVLGPKQWGVPLIIAFNWLVIVYCCGISTHTMLMKALHAVAKKDKQPPKSLKALAVILDGAALAVLFDYVMEPVAVKLGFWQWNPNGVIPVYNYVCWFVASAGLLTLFHFSGFNKQNKFAINLLLINGMFFLLLRTFL